MGKAFETDFELAEEIMTRQLFIWTIFLSCAVAHGQADSADYYIKRLQKWDYMANDYAPSMDYAQNYLWKKGKPIAKKLLPLLDSTDYAVTAHTLLTLIYDGTWSPKRQTLHRSDTLHVVSISLNGLEWTTTFHGSEDQKSGTVTHTFINNSYEKTKEMWRKRVSQ